jgi:hypothetical protein
MHGLVPALPDQGSDYSLRQSTIGHNLAAFDTVNVQAVGFGGGQVLAPYEDGYLGWIRQRSRDAVFGSRGGLYLMKVSDRTTWTAMESYDGGQNHTYLRLDLDIDRFGLPFLSFVDQQQGEEICVYRPNDTDRDQLPDAHELVLGTNPDRADTDGDGTNDGDEVFAGTDPLRR